MKRDLLLDAAEQILADHGTQALTLAAVAERAGVSKGGLLYHFASKEALVKALIERLVTDFDALVDRHDTGGPGSYSRAYVEAVFAVLDDSTGRIRRRWAAVSVAACDSQLLAPLHDATHRWLHTDDAHPDPVTARTVRLAADGLWEALDIAPDLYTRDEIDALHRRLLTLLDGTA